MVEDSGTQIAADDAVDELAPEGDAAFLVWLCHKAENQFSLRVHECDAPGAPARWGPVTKVHAPNSYHYRHRAADISGGVADMATFTKWLTSNFTARITELIHNPNGSVANGKRVPSSYWGSAWGSHRNHVHLAI